MKAYCIAELKCNMNIGGRAAKQALPYLTGQAAYEFPDIVISVSEERIARMSEKYGVSADEAEYYLSGYDFYKQLLSFNGCFLHASAVAYQNRAYLFSADSGVGKSTHTALWLKNFPGAYILNDDKPALRKMDGRFFVFGTPWSGKTDLNRNEKVPLGAICFLERSEHNDIAPLKTGEAIGLFMRQTYNYHFRPEMTEKLFSLMNELFTQYHARRLRCRPDDAAARLAYNTLKEDGNEN